MAYLDNFPVSWAHPVAVVTMPDEIDIADAEDVRGASAFARAHLRARASGGQVRLVARAPIVRRVLVITGMDHLMPVFDSLSAALPAQLRADPSRTEAAAAPPPPRPPGSPRPAHGA